MQNNILFCSKFSGELEENAKKKTEGKKWSAVIK